MPCIWALLLLSLLFDICIRVGWVKDCVEGVLADQESTKNQLYCSLLAIRLKLVKWIVEVKTSELLTITSIVWMDGQQCLMELIFGGCVIPKSLLLLKAFVIGPSLFFFFHLGFVLFLLLDLCMEIHFYYDREYSKHFFFPCGDFSTSPFRIGDCGFSIYEKLTSLNIVSHSMNGGHQDSFIGSYFSCSFHPFRSNA